MRVRIHRGAREIGGTCVELEAADERIVLDLGLPLDAAAGEKAALPHIPGLGIPGDGSLLGVVLSHPHQDHYGLLAMADSSVAVYAGKAATAILDAASFFSPSGLRMTSSGHLEDRVPVTRGPFTITPYLVDHSAYDSYALLVEAGGRRLFYSGDFRAHGRKASLVRKLVANPPSDVDVLVLEGTRVRVDGADPIGLDEHAVELAMAELFGSTDGLAVVFSASQNIDRLVSTYRACVRAGRTLVIDLYTATIAAATGRTTIPHPGFPELGVYVPDRQRILVKRSGEFERVNQLRRHRIFQEEIRERSAELVVLIQSSTLPELARADCLKGATAVWSLWPGYLDQPSGRRTRQLLESLDIPLHLIHASGHARVEDLKALADAMSPARVAPIHTSAPEQFVRLFEPVELHRDGEWWDA
jgi:ribonuclease J